MKSRITKIFLDFYTETFYFHLMKQMYVYILSNKKNGVLYIGVTNDLIRRIWQHKKKYFKSFTQKYNVDKLVYFESLDSEQNAIEREKQLKNWHRDWKVSLIEKNNPNWDDLYKEIIR